MDRPKPTVLVILDGWGMSAEPEYNAIAAARTPVWDRLWRERPHIAIRTSGSSVGLPSGQMGNSEVGHLNLGAGRVVYQEFTRVSRSIRTGSFYTNRTLTDAVDTALQNDKAVHIIGLLSPGGVHSHEEHIHAAVKLAAERGAERIFVHAFLDGRDMPPQSARASLEAMERVFGQLGRGRIASVVGRYYAMDRDHRWERIKAAYEVITDGQAEFEAPDSETALEMAYARGETDEFVKATRIVLPGAGPVTIEDNNEFDIPVAFPPERLANGFGEYIANLGLHQLRLAETEKYAHVTFFFNGGIEEPFEGEERVLVPSPKVATYDLQPEMSAPPRPMRRRSPPCWLPRSTETNTT